MVFYMSALYCLVDNESGSMAEMKDSKSLPFHASAQMTKDICLVFGLRSANSPQPSRPTSQGHGDVQHSNHHQLPTPVVRLALVLRIEYGFANLPIDVACLVACEEQRDSRNLAKSSVSLDPSTPFLIDQQPLLGIDQTSLSPMNHMTPNLQLPA